MPGRQSRAPASWSWHRLADSHARHLVDASGVGRGDLVLDLGAGDGAITAPLAASGARVIAFELHPRRSAELQRRFDRGQVKVVRGDVRDLRLPRRPFRVVANPPFDGVSAILVRLTSPHSHLTRADLIVPRSVGRAWSQRLVSRRLRWTITEIRPLPRSAFRPRPRIDCCAITLTLV